MPSHIPLVEEDRVIGLDGKPLAPLPVNAWAGLPFEVHPHMRKGEVAHRYNPHPLLLVRLRAHGRSRIRSGLSVFDLSLAPGPGRLVLGRLPHGPRLVGLHPRRSARRRARSGARPFGVRRRDRGHRRAYAPRRSATRCSRRSSRASAAKSIPAARRGACSPRACRWPCWRGCASATAAARRAGCPKAPAASSRPGSCRTRSPSSTPTSAPTSAWRRSPGSCR